jgi:adenine-specific DNA-methyltransferase
MDTLTETKKQGFNELDILGWEWEMGLNDNIIKEVKDLFNIKLSLKIIPREVMDKRAVDSGDINFYELAHLNVELKQEKNRIKVQLNDFIIPNSEEIPEDVQKKIKKWGDYIDYWAVDWDYKDVFHNEWQTYRTKQTPNLKLETNFHEYEKGKYKILIKVIDIFGNDTSTIKEINIK